MIHKHESCRISAANRATFWQTPDCSAQCDGCVTMSDTAWSTCGRDGHDTRLQPESEAETTWCELDFVVGGRAAAVSSRFGSAHKRLLYFHPGWWPMIPEAASDAPERLNQSRDFCRCDAEKI